MGHKAQLGNIKKKGFSIAPGVAEDECSLPEIVDRECGECHAEPRSLDRPPAEVAEVGIECFRAGHGEKHEAKDGETNQAVVEKKC